MTIEEKAQLAIDLLKEYLDPRYKDALDTYNPENDLYIHHGVFEKIDFDFIVESDDIFLIINFMKVRVKDENKFNVIADFYEHGCRCWDDTIKFLKEQTGYEEH